MNNQLQKLRMELNQQFPERREVIDGCLAAVLAGEHVLLLGPPGTAKSALVRSLAQAFGGSYFERLLTKFSTPEELFGPISINALENDRFARVTSGKLPQSHFAFVDEVFKANSSILNSLLTLLNERVFHNDGAPTPAPLISLFGASNELPEGNELEALWDRFIVRFHVDYLLRPSNLRAVLTAQEPALSCVLDLKALRNMQAQVAKVMVTDPTVDALVTVRDALKQEGIVVSDRRWKKSLKLAQAVAYLSGQAETSPEDLAILSDVLWREPKERQKIARVVGRHADPVSFQAQEVLDSARETAAKVAALTSGDRKAYVAQASETLEEFRAQQTKLNQLAKGAGPRATDNINEALAEVHSLYAELARAVSTGLGLGMRAVK